MKPEAPAIEIEVRAEQRTPDAAAVESLARLLLHLADQTTEGST